MSVFLYNHNIQASKPMFVSQFLYIDFIRSLSGCSMPYSQKLISIWKKRFGEEVDESLLFVVSVERILQMEDFKEVGKWVSSSDYRSAQPDPLRDLAEKLVNEINVNHVADVNRFCNVYVDLNFQVSEAKLIWVDRLGFDMRLWSPSKGIFEVRIPFPAEVTDEKGAKSTFNCMSQLAWEVEKNFNAPDFQKVKEVKQIS
ncbi:FMN-binding split barrel [Parasponia andersonii]|uniref:FMN-binding split barrel n=1 Tax=Parasponia andersonii TaxID=3476 RepID=A0A2P5DK93_PARAD|nr:FMN-binding split barrel [Parasponia andersonii]